MKILSTVKPLAASFALGFAVVSGVNTAIALPPGGANTVNTAGTSSTVSPGTLKAGDTISFKLTGFPANEQVYVKVDDGEACPSDSAQGACVVHQQKSDSSGTVEGSFVLSKELAEGEHTLRFLATQNKTDSNGNSIGSIGFSNRSPVFTISGVNENSTGGTQVNVDPDVINHVEESVNNNNANNSSSDSGSNSSSEDKSKDSNSGSNNSGSNSGSNDSGSNNSGSNSGSSSNNNSGSSNSGSGSVEEETVYLDADGNKITKEEYDALMAQDGSAAVMTSAAPKAEESSAAASETASANTSASASASKQASSTASATATASASSSKKAENVTTASGESSGSDFPWVGAGVLAVALVAAGGVLLARRKNS